MTAKAAAPMACGWVLACLLAMWSPAAVAQEAAQESDAPPRQRVTERSPIRTDTTFIFRFRKVPSTLEAGDIKVTLIATQLPIDDREYARIATLEPGEHLRLERSPVMKLRATAPLEIGSARLPTGNVAADYPGTYGLWIQRTEAGWQAVFNDEADAWGTQHDPTFDRATVPLDYVVTDAVGGPLSGRITGTPDDALLAISWGEHHWSVPFRIAGDAAPDQTSRGAESTGPTGSTNWGFHGGDLGATRYSPLDVIDASNVDQLRVLWRWLSPDTPLQDGRRERRTFRHEAIPLAIGDRLFTVTSLSQLAALDAGTGEPIWVHDPESWRAGPPTNLGFIHRGTSYWRDPATGAERLIYATSDNWLIAVDGASGKPIADFGDGGRVDLIAGIPLARRPEPGSYRGNVTVSSPPVIVRDVVVVGSSIADRPTTRAMPRGDIRGYDVRTGRLRWTFHTVPQAREFGNDTWEDGSWQITGNTTVWTMMSGDEELGLVYLPLSTPTSDYYGGHRPGANLFAESLVALEASTGRRRWHFQTVHHGLWDYDLPAAPLLADLEINGEPRQIVAQVSKQGFTYVFDRATGEPVWPIEERPVPASAVPGEQAWPTQPFPTKPPPFERQGSSADQVIDFSPELRAEALEILEQYEHGPLFLPPSVKGTLQLPGSAGGANWGGAAFDPESGVLYVPSFTVPIITTVVKGDPARTELEWVGDRVHGYGLREPFGPRGLPLFKPPYARVTAIDLKAGTILWQVPIGEGPRRQVEEITGDDPGPLGSGTSPVHALVTKTLVLVTKAAGRTEDDPGGLWALEKTSGRQVGFVELDPEPGSSPITYLHGGRQYVVVATGGGGDVQELVGLGLP